jgi:hypothetical protein
MPVKECLVSQVVLQIFHNTEVKIAIEAKLRKVHRFYALLKIWLDNFKKQNYFGIKPYTL